MSDLLKSLGAVETRDPQKQGNYRALDIPPVTDTDDLDERASLLAEIGAVGSQLTGIDKNLIIDYPAAFVKEFTGKEGKANQSFLQELRDTLNHRLESFELYSRLGREGASFELMQSIEALNAKDPGHDARRKETFFQKLSEWWEGGRSGEGTDLERAHAEGGAIDLDLLKAGALFGIHGAVGQIPMHGYGAVERTRLSMLYALGFAGVAALATAATGGALPALGAVTVAGAAKMGGAVGAVLGSFENYRYNNAGMTFYELLQVEDKAGNRMDPQVAWTASQLTGAAGAAIQTFQLSELIQGTVANEIVKGTARDALTKMTASRAFVDALKTASARVVVSTGVESVVEVVERISSMAGDYFAKEISNFKDGTSFEHDSLKERADDLTEVFISSLASFLFSTAARAPVNVMNLTHEARQARIGAEEKTQQFEDKTPQEKDSLREFFQEKVKPAFNMDDAKMETALQMVEERARAAGMSSQEWWERNIADVVQSDVEAMDRLMQEDKVLFEADKAKVAVQFLDDGRAVLRALDTADFSSFLYELGHIMRREIQGEDLNTLNQWLGVEKGVWERQHEEAFAESFEQYVETGKAPTRRLQGVFERIREWLKNIYERFSPRDLPDEVIQVFDNLFMTETEQAVDAELSGLIGDYHNEIIAARETLENLEMYMGDELDRNEIEIEGVRKVIEKLEGERRRLEELRSERLSYLPDEVRAVDEFWKSWQESAEAEELYRRMAEVEKELKEKAREKLPKEMSKEEEAVSWVRDVLPSTKESLENTLGFMAAIAPREGKRKSPFKGMDPLWASALVKSLKGRSLSQGHARMLLARVRNNPDTFMSMYFQLARESIGQEEFEMWEMWRQVRIQEKEALERARLEEKKARERALRERDEALRIKLKELLTMRERIQAASEFDNPRTKIRILTGIFTINEILKETKKLSEETLKAVPKAVDKAYREGRREGKEEGARKQREVYREREAEKREKKKIRQYIEKLARRISKPPAMTIDFYYREAIEAIQEGIDPKFRALKTLTRREKFNDFLERHPEKSKEIPSKVKKVMQGKSLGEFTIAELEAIDAEIQTLRKQGRLKRQLEEAQRKRELEKTKNELIKAVLEGQRLEVTRGKGKVSRQKGKVKKIPQNIKAWTLRPQRLFDQLDGGANFKGKVFDFFYNRANRAQDAETRLADERKERAVLKAREIGVDLKKLGTLIRIGDISYSKDEVMDIYAGMQNQLKREAILHGNNLSEKEANEFIQQLSPKDIEWAEYLISEYEKNYERLRKAHIKYTNQDLGHEKSYTPILRLDADYDGNQASMARELLERQNLKKAYAEKGFTKSRIRIGKKHQKEIRLGLTSTWIEQVGRQEHYINGAEAYRDMQWMANNSEFSEALRQMYGSETVKAVKDWVNRVANPDIYKATDGLSKLSRTLRKNTAVGYLAYNLVTMAKQLPSAVYYLPDAGAGHLIKSACQFINPLEAKRMIERAETLDPQMKHRSIERFAEEIKQADSGFYSKIIKKLGETGMVGIYAIDKVATTIGWNAVYEVSLAKGMSQEEAAMEAKNSTLRTQPAAHAKDVAQLYSTSNEAFNWMLMFSNQLNQIYNMITYDLPMRASLSWQGKDLSMAYQTSLTLASLGIGGGLIWAITNKRLPEDEEDIQEMIAETFINSVPVVGQDIMAAAKGYYFSDDISIIKALKGAAGMDERKIIEGVAISLGLPYIAGKRLTEAVEYQDIWELIGGRP